MRQLRLAKWLFGYTLLSIFLSFHFGDWPGRFCFVAVFLFLHVLRENRFLLVERLIHGVRYCIASSMRRNTSSVPRMCRAPDIQCTFC